MKKYISIFLSFVLCLFLTSCASNDSEHADDSQGAFGDSHTAPPLALSWKSFDEIAELKKEVFEQKDDEALLNYLRGSEHYYSMNGLDSKEAVNKLFEQFSETTTLLLKEGCKLKLAEIVYYWDDSSLLIRYQEGSGPTYKCDITFKICTYEDFIEYSNYLSEFTVIDSIDIESNQIDLYATGSYESKYFNVMCSRGCFETDNSYIIISYDTVDESAVLDPCIKDCLQITNLNDL